MCDQLIQTGNTNRPTYAHIKQGWNTAKCVGWQTADKAFYLLFFEVNVECDKYYIRVIMSVVGESAEKQPCRVSGVVKRLL